MIDAKSAGVTTAVVAGQSDYSVAEDGSLVAELTDHFVEPGSGSNGPIIGASLRKSLLTSAHANAQAGACSVTLSSSGPVTFDVEKAKVLVPSFELGTIDALLGVSNSYRGGLLRSYLGQIDSPAVDAAVVKLVRYIDHEVRAIPKGLSVTLTHDETQAALEAAWTAFRECAAVILTETKSSVTADDLVTKTADNTWRINAKVVSPVSQILFVAGSIKTDLDGSARDTNGGWSTLPLER